MSQSLGNLSDRLAELDGRSNNGFRNNAGNQQNYQQNYQQDYNDSGFDPSELEMIYGKSYRNQNQNQNHNISYI